jgi:hypothetical protein
MLVRKFLRCKLTKEAQKLVLKLETYKDNMSEFTPEEMELMIQSLYKTERIWEMEE